MNKVEIYDTTLRDGAQMKDIHFSTQDKLTIIDALDSLGVHFIEVGWPGSNLTDKVVFQRIDKTNLKNSAIVGFSMTCRKGIKAKNDKGLIGLLHSGVRIVTLVGKSSLSHVTRVLRTTQEENLRLIEESCLLFSQSDRRVFYDAEHFFDAFKENAEYAVKTLNAAVNGGAERIVLCDTNGGGFPNTIGRVVHFVSQRISNPLGIHAHNDSGLAVACSYEAVKRGVIQVQGTINGYGERCGNTDLCTLIPNLQLKLGISCLPQESLMKITKISHIVAEIANLRPDPTKPYVGVNAFTHKGGMHVDAMAKWSKSYQHVDPHLVGNYSQTTVSQLSGKGNISIKAKELGINLNSEQIIKVLGQIKQLEYFGFQFEGADGSVELLMRRASDNYQKPFDILDFNVSVRKNFGLVISEAIVEVCIREKKYKEVAEGNGPINALDLALRKALVRHYPALRAVYLVDYKVRILNSKDGTNAKVRVLIEFSDKVNNWTTVGCSTNIIEASLVALIDGLEYSIFKNIPATQ